MIRIDYFNIRNIEPGEMVFYNPKGHTKSSKESPKIPIGIYTVVEKSVHKLTLSLSEDENVHVDCTDCMRKF